MENQHEETDKMSIEEKKIWHPNLSRLVMKTDLIKVLNHTIIIKLRIKELFNQFH